MKTIKDKDGIIQFYENWKGIQQPAEEVFQMLLGIQTEQLADWKLKLNEVCFNALQQVVTAANKDLDPSKDNAYDRIKRGTDLDTFIANWKPDKPISEIYW